MLHKKFSLYRGNIKKVCIDNNFCTLCDSEKYEKDILVNVEFNSPELYFQELERIAKDIACYSESSILENLYTFDGVIGYIMNELNKYTYIEIGE